METGTLFHFIWWIESRVLKNSIYLKYRSFVTFINVITVTFDQVSVIAKYKILNTFFLKKNLTSPKILNGSEYTVFIFFFCNQPTRKYRLLCNHLLYLHLYIMCRAYDQIASLTLIFVFWFYNGIISNISLSLMLIYSGAFSGFSLLSRLPWWTERSLQAPGDPSILGLVSGIPLNWFTESPVRVTRGCHDALHPGIKELWAGPNHASVSQLLFRELPLVWLPKAVGVFSNGSPLPPQLRVMDECLNCLTGFFCVW